jgi:hypothetical protein
VITVKARGPSRFRVEVDAGQATTTHDVEIPDGFRDELAVTVDDERVVRETFSFLLEREPATSIMSRFSLDVVSRFFPDYIVELRARLLA